MQLSIKTQKSNLPLEGEVEAITGALKQKSETKLTMPFRFTQDGKGFEAHRDYPNKPIEAKDELFRDAQVILHRPFTEQENAGGFDASVLENQPCRIVVLNKRTAGGKHVPVVTTVLARKEASN